MFVKHVGKQGDRKVAIVFREVPGEEHMALVLYPETLSVNFHQAVMRVLESEPGQQAESLGEVLFRELLPDGRQILETLHKEGMIKKVQASQIIVTPNAQSRVRLDELNKVMNEMKRGEAAKQVLQDIDTNTGLVNPREQAATVLAKQHAAQANAVPTGPLTDADLAKNNLAQAARMKIEAEALLAESTRLTQEANQLDPATKPVRRARATKKNAIPAE